MIDSDDECLDVEMEREKLYPNECELLRLPDMSKVPMQGLMAKSFSKEAKGIYGNRYCYSFVRYLGPFEEIMVWCYYHGMFEVTPHKHMLGFGCRICEQLRKNYEFIIKADKHHKGRYAYNLVHYINARTKVKIVCHSHGTFRQTPDGHLNSKVGCRQCYFDSIRRKQGEFIEIAMRVHKGKYTYEKVKYVRGKDKVNITCKVHGPFYVPPQDHIKGIGCRKCYDASHTKSQEQFFKDAILVHGKFYSYGRTIYVKSTIPVIITCPIHGDFEQLPSDHVRADKRGCNGCKNGGVSKPSLSWLAYMEVKLKAKVRHAKFGGEFRIPKSRYHVDGYVEATRTVLEFHGDYWHGNPSVYDMDAINPSIGITYMTLLVKTKTKELFIRTAGFTYICIWESEWKQLINAAKVIQRRWRKRFC